MFFFLKKNLATNMASAFMTSDSCKISYKILVDQFKLGYQLMSEIWPSNLFYSSPKDSICILSDSRVSFDSNDLKYPLTPGIRQFNLVWRHVMNLT